MSGDWQGLSSWKPPCGRWRLTLPPHLISELRAAALIPFAAASSSRLPLTSYDGYFWGVDTSAGSDEGPLQFSTGAGAGGTIFFI